MVKKITFKIYTLGCKVNQYDSNFLAKRLQIYGLKLVKNQADIALVNSCAITKSAITKTRKMITKAKRENPNAKIILFGCWPNVYEIKNKEAGSDKVIISHKFNDLLNIIGKIAGITLHNKSLSVNNLVQNDKARYFLKIQDGCEQFCSYCIVPFARGKIKSGVEEEIIKEIKKAISCGYQEIILSGIHLGKYGQDLGNTNLTSFLKKIIKIKKLGRIRLSSIEVNEIPNELIKLISSCNKIAKHLHLPLQSGSNKILKLMNRPYNIQFFKDKIKNIKENLPEIALSTDIIVGFPGETLADFAATYKFIQEIGFSRLHIFPFSAHEKTKAFSLPDKVSDQEKSNRVKKLRQLNICLQKKYYQNFIGKIVKVVVEKKQDNEYIGKTEYYFDVKFKPSDLIKKNIAQQLKIKQLVEIKIPKG